MQPLKSNELNIKLIEALEKCKVINTHLENLNKERVMKTFTFSIEQLCSDINSLSTKSVVTDDMRKNSVQVNTNLLAEVRKEITKAELKKSIIEEVIIGKSGFCSEKHGLTHRINELQSNLPESCTNNFEDKVKTNIWNGKVLPSNLKKHLKLFKNNLFETVKLKEDLLINLYAFNKVRKLNNLNDPLNSEQSILETEALTVLKLISKKQSTLASATSNLFKQNEHFKEEILKSIQRIEKEVDIKNRANDEISPELEQQNLKAKYLLKKCQVIESQTVLRAQDIKSFLNTFENSNILKETKVNYKLIENISDKNYQDFWNYLNSYLGIKENVNLKVLLKDDQLFGNQKLFKIRAENKSLESDLKQYKLDLDIEINNINTHINSLKNIHQLSLEIFGCLGTTPPGDSSWSIFKYFGY